MKVEFTQFDNSTNWVGGIVNDGQYSFGAKLFDEGSDYGIHNDGYEGRVSKLTISIGDKWTGWETCICNYDRGWDVLPKNYEVFIAVMDLLENSPKRFDD